VVISADGHTMAVGGSEGAVSLWNIRDPARPHQIGTPFEAHDDIRTLEIAADGRTLASAGDDGTVRLWDLAELDDVHEQLVERACTRAHRDLNEDEWNRFVGPDYAYQRSCAG
jgi:WD40 repeat protein